MTLQLLDQSQDHRMILSGISWQQMEGIATSFETIPGVKLAYLDRCLEIMTTGDEHEDLKKTIAMLLEAYMRTQGIRFYGRGAPTLGNPEQNVRREPDESYNINRKKAIPDFLIEVVITSGGLDKLACYQRLQIPEVWFWMDDQLSIYQLQETGYLEVAQSQLLPNLDLDVLAQFIAYGDQYDAVTEFLNAIGQV